MSEHSRNDPERDAVYIAHMLECIAKIERYTSSGRERFFADSLIQDAVTRVLQVMAESSQRLSPAIKETEPHIDWRGISGFRNILVHEYLGGIDTALLWTTIQQDLPALKAALRRMAGR